MMADRKKNQHGAVMIELAIMLPLLAVLAFGVAELGTAFLALNALNKAVRDGVRFKSYDTTLSDADIENKVESVMNGLPAFYSGSPTTVAVSTPVIAGLNHVRVDANYNHQLLLGQTLCGLVSIIGGSGFCTGSIPLSAFAVMRVRSP